MKVTKRLCIKDWSVTAESGDHFEIRKGEIYTTAEEPVRGEIMVFSNYWVPVPQECLTTEGAPL